jgi:PKD repeat protein
MQSLCIWEKGNRTELKKILASTLLAVIALSVMPVFAAWPPPSHPHDSNAFWIEPPSLSFSTSTTTLPHMFNVTVYLNVTGTYVFNYQVNMTYDPTQLNMLEAGYTHGSESDFYYPRTALSSPIARGPSSALMGEALVSPLNITGYGSLIWAEFNITATPPTGGTLTSMINITNPDTWVQAPDMTFPPIGRFNALYSFTSRKPLPVPLFDFSPKSPLVNQTITLDGSASYDPVGTIVTWAWTFGDTGTASGKIVTHKYKSPGTYQVNLTVTDNGALSNSTTKQVTVYTTPPVSVTKLYVNPSQIINYTLLPPIIFTVNVTVANVTNLYDYKFKLSYSKVMLTCIGAIINTVQNQTNFTPIILINGGAGFMSINVSYSPPAVPITSMTPQSLATIFFRLNTLGSSNLTLYDTELSDPSGLPIFHQTGNGFIMTAIRDVAIVSVVPSRSWTYLGVPVNIAVTAKNLGQATESFNVSAYYNSSLIRTQQVDNLNASQQVAMVFTWNTTGLTPRTNYIIEGVASYVPFEFNKTNNLLLGGKVHISILGDINGDDRVDMKDVGILAVAFGSYGPDGPNWKYPDLPASPRWDPRADVSSLKYLVPDNTVDLFDVALIARHFGEH